MTQFGGKYQICILLPLRPSILAALLSMRTPLMAERTFGWQCLFKLWMVNKEWVLTISPLHRHLQVEHVPSLQLQAPHWALILTWAVVTGKVTASPCLTVFNTNYRKVYMDCCTTALVVLLAHGYHLETCLGIILWSSMSQWLIIMVCLLQQFICLCRYRISFIILTLQYFTLQMNTINKHL